MDVQAVRERLRRLGLTETEVTAYLTLLRSGELTAGELAAESDISQGYLYEVLDGLADRDLVVLNDHVTPTTVRPRPPGEAVDRLVADLTDLQSALEGLFTEHAAALPEVDMVRSRRTSYRRLRELVGSAEQEVLLAIPAQAATDLADELAAARDRGALVLVLLGDVRNAGEAAVQAAAEGATVVRTWDERGHQFVASVDGHAAVVGDANLLHGEHRADDDALVVENSRKLAWAIEALTWSFWAAAEEAHVADSVDLPAAFRSMTHAVVQARLHREAGTPVAVEATVSADGTETVAGRVVEVRQSVLAPATGDIALENGLVLETADGERVTVGGRGAFVEDHAASTVTLRRAE